MSAILAFFVACAGIPVAFMIGYFCLLGWFPRLPPVSDRALWWLAVMSVFAGLGGTVLAVLVLADAWAAIFPLRLTG